MRSFILSFLILCGFFILQTSSGLASEVNRFDEKRSIQPSDFFPDFPDLKFGMSFVEAKKALEKAGIRAVAPVKSQLVWDGTFNQMAGRGTLVFDDDQRLFQISAVISAMEKRKEVFEDWSKRIVEKHGKPTELDNEDVTSRLWKLNDGVMLELKLVKDDNSPVLDIRWVK